MPHKKKKPRIELRAGVMGNMALPVTSRRQTQPPLPLKIEDTYPEGTVLGFHLNSRLGNFIKNTQAGPQSIDKTSMQNAKNKCHHTAIITSKKNEPIEITHAVRKGVVSEPLNKYMNDGTKKSITMALMPRNEELGKKLSESLNDEYLRGIAYSRINCIKASSILQKQPIVPLQTGKPPLPLKIDKQEKENALITEVMCSELIWTQLKRIIQTELKEKIKKIDTSKLNASISTNKNITMEEEDNYVNINLNDQLTHEEKELRQLVELNQFIEKCTNYPSPAQMEQLLTTSSGLFSSTCMTKTTTNQYSTQHERAGKAASDALQETEKVKATTTKTLEIISPQPKINSP